MSDFGPDFALCRSARGIVKEVDACRDSDPAPIAALLVLHSETDILWQVKE
jgi:hypothetical protein